MPRDADRDLFIDALCSADLADIVDLVCWVEDDPGGRTAYAANSVGRVRFHADGPAEVLAGSNPIGSEDPLAFLPYERGDRQTPRRPARPRTPTRSPPPGCCRSSPTPTAAPTSPSCTRPRHFFPDEGGHVGEHGSLDVIQSRAPFILSGAGVTRLGPVDDHARLVDVGPTLAHLAGVPDEELRDAHGPRPGRQSADRPTSTRAAARTHVIGILWDGGHCGDLLHLAETGELPGVARLIERGVALRAGAVAEFPSITLTNHTAILTGVGPGRHGVMGNVYYDRATGETVVPNDESTWHRSAEWLLPSVRTVFEMVDDHLGPGERTRTASVDEAIDRGADYSTMARDPGQRRERCRRAGRRAAGPAHLAVPAQSRLPRPTTTSVVPARRRPGAPADAGPVGGPGAGPGADLVGQRRHRRGPPRWRPALGHGAGLPPAVRRPAVDVPGPPRVGSGSSTT